MLARTQYDPTIDPNAKSLLGTAQGANPTVLLDQMWLRFDVRRRFRDRGKQHVKLGNRALLDPDRLPAHRPPRTRSAVFDARTGIHHGQAPRAVGSARLELLRPGHPRAAHRLDPDRLGRPEPGARADLDAVRRGRRRRAGPSGRSWCWALPSWGSGPFTSAGTGRTTPPTSRSASGSWTSTARRRSRPEPESRSGRRSPAPPPTRLSPAGTSWPTSTTSRPQAVAGLRWGHKYNDEDHLEAGVEYFYNHTGYTDSSIYPWLLLNNAFVPFYVGKHYLGVYLQLPSPGSWNDTTFILSTLGNLSDSSYVTRLDHSVMLLTYLRLETFVAVHYGARGGEFRLGLSIPSQDLGGGVVTPAITVGTPQVDVGVALRVSL